MHANTPRMCQASEGVPGQQGPGEAAAEPSQQAILDSLIGKLKGWGALLLSDFQSVMFIPC